MPVRRTLPGMKSHRHQRPMKLDVVTTNLHVVSKHQVDAMGAILRRIKAAFGRWPDVIGCQEAIQLQGVKRVGRYRVVKTNRKRPHDNTNVILIKRWFPVESSTWHFGAPAFGGGLNHHPRHFHVLKYRKWGRKAAHIDTHLSVIPEPHARTRVKSPDHLDPLVRTHAAMVLGIVATANKLRAQGYVVTITADSNDNHDWQYGLARVLREHGYLIVRHGIDVIAVHQTQAHRRRKRPLVVSKRVTLSDHAAVAAAFNLAA